MFLYDRVCNGALDRCTLIFGSSRFSDSVLALSRVKILRVYNLQVWRNWQTRMVQVHVKAISCRFKSCYLHQFIPSAYVEGIFLVGKYYMTPVGI